MKKVVALLLSLMLLLCILPISALAEEWTDAPEFAMEATRNESTITLKLYPKTQFVFSSLGFDVSYPNDKVTLVENMDEESENYIVEKNKIGTTKFPTMNLTTGKIGYAYAGSTNTTFAAEKAVLVVHFTVNDGASGGIDFKVTKLNASQAGNIAKIYTEEEFPTATINLTPSTPTHEHSWSDEWSSDATYHWHECAGTGACDVTNNANKDGHATHTYNKDVVSPAYLKSDATCTTPATYYKSCVCGAFSTTAAAFTNGGTTPHNLSSTYQSDENGHWQKCTNAGCIYTTPKANHIGGTATCTEKAACTACSQKYGALDPTNHIHTNAVVAVASTGKTAGHAAYTKCADCNVIVTGSDVALPLNPNNHEGQKGTEWNNDRTEHWHVYPCCNAKVDKAAHISSGAATEASVETCTTCGYVIAPATGHIRHTLTNHPANPATCTAAGNIEYWTCSGCNDKFSDADETNKITGSVTIAALGHDHSGAWVTTDEDEHWKVCAREGCNEQLDKNSHAISDAWLSNGNGHYHECSICHKQSQVVAHTYKSAYDNTQHWLIYKECGYEQAGSRENHTFEGDSKYCNDQCGYTKSAGSITIITRPDSDNNGTKENPGTGAAPGSIGYVFVGLVAVGALCFGAKKFIKKDEE